MAIPIAPPATPEPVPEGQGASGAAAAQQRTRAAQQQRPRTRGGTQAAGSQFEQLHPRGRGGKWIVKLGDGYGSGGPDQTTVQLQERLRQLGYQVPQDGKFGVATEAAVKAFQRDYGLSTSGGVDAATLELLRNPAGSEGGPRTTAKAAAAAKKAASSGGAGVAGKSATRKVNKRTTPKKPAAPSPPTRSVRTSSRPTGTRRSVRRAAPSGKAGARPASRGGTPHIGALGADDLRRGLGMTGAPDATTRTLQRMLNEALGGAHLDVDGRFGPKTQAAVRRFQKTHHLKPTGVVDDQTKRMLLKVADRRKARKKALAKERRKELYVPYPKPAKPRSGGGGAGMTLTKLHASAGSHERDLEENMPLQGWGDQPDRSIRDYRSEGEPYDDQGLGPQPDRSIQDYRSEEWLRGQLEMAVEERKATATSTEFTRALARENVFRRRLEELDWNPELHPRGRAGRWVDVLGRLEHEHGRSTFETRDRGGTDIRAITAKGRTMLPMASSQEALQHAANALQRAGYGNVETNAEALRVSGSKRQLGGGSSLLVKAMIPNAASVSLKPVGEKHEATVLASDRAGGPNLLTGKSLASRSVDEVLSHLGGQSDKPKAPAKKESPGASFLRGLSKSTDIRAVTATPKPGGRVRLEHPSHPGRPWGPVLRVKRSEPGKVHTVDRYGNEHAHTPSQLIPVASPERIQAVSRSPSPALLYSVPVRVDRLAAGDDVQYYHAMLGETFDAKIVRKNKRGVVFEFTSGPPDIRGQRRSLTLRQAEEKLSRNVQGVPRTQQMRSAQVQEAIGEPMKTTEERLAEAIEQRKAATTSTEFVTARAREDHLRRRLAEEALEDQAQHQDDERWPASDIKNVADELGIDIDGADLSDVSAELHEAMFIQSAIKRPGQLHRDLGVPPGQTIPKAQIVAAAAQPGKVGQRARLALKLMKLRPAKKAAKGAKKAA
jgi:peptidoglycan hydrolase-like protein with peptidoglycan-binding domain